MSGVWCPGLTQRTASLTPAGRRRWTSASSRVRRATSARANKGKSKGDKGKFGKDKNGKAFGKKGGKKDGKAEPFNGECGYCGKRGHN